jgi:hypothetical protein
MNILIEKSDEAIQLKAKFANANLMRSRSPWL